MFCCAALPQAGEPMEESSTPTQQLSTPRIPGGSARQVACLPMRRPQATALAFGSCPSTCAPAGTILTALGFPSPTSQLHPPRAAAQSKAGRSSPRRRRRAAWRRSSTPSCQQQSGKASAPVLRPAAPSCCSHVAGVASPCACTPGTEERRRPKLLCRAAQLGARYVTLRRDSKAMARLQQRAGVWACLKATADLLAWPLACCRGLADGAPSQLLPRSPASSVSPLAVSISPDAPGSGEQQPRKRARTSAAVREQREEQQQAQQQPPQQAQQPHAGQQQGTQPHVRHPLQELTLSPDGVPRRSGPADQNAAAGQQPPSAATSPASAAVGTSWLVSAAQPRPRSITAPEEGVADVGCNPCGPAT